MPRIRAATIEEHKELTRRRLLEATQELLLELGYDVLTLGDVAATAGIGRTTVYEYFHDKEDLIASLVEETLPQVVDDLLASVPSDIPVDARLAALAVATVQFVASDTVLGLVLHRDAPKLSLAAQERIHSAHGNLATEFAGLHQRGVAEGVFRPMPPRLAGRFIQDLIMSAAASLVADPDPAAVREETASAAADFLLHGLSSGAAPAEEVAR